MKFDATSMHVQPQVAAQQKMVDDGSGEVQVGGLGEGPCWLERGRKLPYHLGPHADLILIPGVAH